ncbi:hypothetical protein H4R34_004118 [Dimargaris verticillata]|uniref:Uncharacterized protein n=1 Tax=Dimargaris verticillata TaxID=2761393 RepID=A0A9W8B379_9FUNG|nr:hypothetical protein H4R34_004118 [Dimargaris verticillata]
MPYPAPDVADPIIDPQAPHPAYAQDIHEILDKDVLTETPALLDSPEAETFIRSYRERHALTHSELHQNNPFSDGSLLEYAKKQIERVELALALEQHLPPPELHTTTCLSPGDYMSMIYGALMRFTE